jgi:hypothetical protein
MPWALDCMLRGRLRAEPAVAFGGLSQRPATAKKLLLVGAMIFAAANFAVRAPAAARRAQQPAQQEATQQLVDVDQRLGPFALGTQQYAVVLHKKRFAGGDPQKPAEALASLEVQDADGNIVYQESDSYEAGDGRFARSVSAGATLFSGHGGAALAIRFTEQPAATPANESWLVLGMVNGKLTSFGAPGLLGQVPGMQTNGVLTGVMLRGGIGVQALDSRAEPSEFRIWSGNFYVSIPVLVDWAQGKWSEGEQCFELNEGTLRPKGCNLRADPGPQARRSEVTFAQLFAETDGNRYNSQQVTVRPDSTVELLQTRSLVQFMPSGNHFAANFDDVWLQVRVDGKQGWVHGEQDFAALGLPARGTPQ